MRSTMDAEALPRFAPRAYYGWVIVLVAAAAMVGTLPGRTQGLGLITEPLLRDYQMTRVAYAQINLVATLVGALFCFGIGTLMDRQGSRLVLTGLALALGATVLTTTMTSSVLALATLITLTRGLGQSSLSIVSMAMVGKWFRRRITQAMAVYAVAMSVGFMTAFPIVGAVVSEQGWRVAWGIVGASLLLVLAPVAWTLVRDTPESIGLAVDDDAAATADAREPEPASDATLGEALRSPAFWVFGVASAIYGLIASGIGLFNESILAERGFASGVYHQALAVTAITALGANFAAGAYAARRSLRRVLIGALVILAAALACVAPSHDRAASDGTSRRDGNRRRLRDGRVLQLLAARLRPHAPGAHPGRSPGAHRAGFSRRSARARLLHRAHRFLRFRFLSPIGRRHAARSCRHVRACSLSGCTPVVREMALGH